MMKYAALTLAILGALLAGCSNDDGGHEDGDHHDMHSDNMMPDVGGHDAMSPGDMDHGSETSALPADANRRCPVTGEDVDGDIHVDYMGKTVYFCCDDCVEKFNADPAQYLAKAYPDAGK